MATTFYFFSNGGSLLYTRSDAIEFEHYCLNMSCMGVFPSTGNIPVVGQLVGWKDAEGIWEIQEIISTEADGDAKEIEIRGTNIGVSELSRLTHFGTIKFDNKRMKTAVKTILETSFANWQVGTMPTAAQDDPQELQRYRVVSSVPMYANMNTSSILHTYKADSYLNLIETSGTWLHMSDQNGRTGWLSNAIASGKIVRDGFKDDDTRTASIDEEFQTVWDMINKCSEQTGYIIVPRVTVSSNGTINGRYLDAIFKSNPYRGLRLNCNTNISNATVKYSIDNMYTSMIGIGKDDIRFRDIVWEAAEGYPVNKESGKSYVSLPDREAVYGIRRGVVNFDEISEKKKLLYRTYEYLKSMSEPTVTISGTIADLYSMGYNGTPIHIYDTAYVYIEPIGIKVQLTVTDLTRDLVEPEKTNAVLGSINDSDFITILAGRKGK